jgi:hypothetical protein
MSPLINSFNFVPLKRFPQVEGTVRFLDVCTALWQKNTGGFILAEAGAPHSFVNANDLAATVVLQSGHNPELLNKYCSMPVGQLISMVAQAKPAPVLPVVHEPVSVQSEETPLASSPQGIFSIVDRNLQIGWYINNEAIRAAVTKRTVYVCANGHKNPDPDHGSCYQCPAPIDRTETE